ncbi:unnamed protein product, partial [Allacma fusca]
QIPILYVDGIKARRSDITKQALRQTSYYQRLDQRSHTDTETESSTCDPLFDPPVRSSAAAITSKGNRWDLPLLQHPIPYHPAHTLPEELLREFPVSIPSDGTTGHDPRDVKRSPSSKRTLAPIASPICKRFSPPPTLKSKGLILELFGSSDNDETSEKEGNDNLPGPPMPDCKASEEDDSDSSAESTSSDSEDSSVQIDRQCDNQKYSPSYLVVSGPPLTPSAPLFPTDTSDSPTDIHAVAVQFFAGVYDFNLDECDQK